MASTPNGIPLLDTSAKIAPIQAHYNAIALALDTSISDLNSVINNVSQSANLRAGTAAQRAAFTSSAPLGFVWQDTDGESDTWRKGTSGWELLVSSYYSGNVVSNVVDMEPGWALETERYRQLGAQAHFYLHFRRTGGTISVPNDGNIVNQQIATLTSNVKLPSFSISANLAGRSSGPITQGYISQEGLVMLSAVSPGRNITAGSQYELTGFYWVK